FVESMQALVGYLGKLFSGGELTTSEFIVGEIRLPRAIAVIGVGIALSVAGAIMQAMIRNPLVDPYITGTSSGAAVAATVVMVIGFGITSSLLDFAVPIAAFVGAMAAFFFTMSLAEASGGRALNYVLAGIVTGTALSSVTTLLLTSFPTEVQDPLFWMFGSFNQIDWTKALLIILPSLVMCLIALLYARELNVILLGHEQSYQLGIDSRRLRRWMMVLAAMLTAVAVAFVGIIGFLGLIVPHICRIMVGSDHRLLLPASMIIGANVLLVADIICKTATGGELPVGAVIALVGAPFFGYLLVRKGREYAG
ncbi:MAG TPA: iron ABC transporter permease, partial [Methanomassiliicoccales archaeon]|nr:iron ABC transporter permease [Methanomassiliicoccales archaeon]